MSERIRVAMDRFEVPQGREKFLFCLPAMYVAKADGKISFKEAMSVIWNSLMLGLVKPQGDEKTAFDAFVKSKILTFQGKSDLSDFVMLADAINDLLDTYGPSEAQEIRKAIHGTCTKVAEASGPMFRDKVSAEERDMLDRIFARL